MSSLTETVNKHHDDVVKRLDEVNHVKEYMGQRLTETDNKIEVAIGKQNEMMAAHISSPQHVLMSEHVAAMSKYEAPLRVLSPEDVEFIPEIVKHARTVEETKARKNALAKTREVKVATIYQFLASIVIVFSAILWLVVWLAAHFHR